MIKQSTTQERPVFGVDPTPKKKRQVNKVEKPVTETPCAFQVLDIIGCNVKSKPCQYEALANGWCSEHKHAQAGMDEGKRLGWRSVEIAEAYTIIGQGRLQWEAYFERATGSGLARVMDYLSKL